MLGKTRRAQPESRLGHHRRNQGQPTRLENPIVRGLAPHPSPNERNCLGRMEICSLGRGSGLSRGISSGFLYFQVSPSSVSSAISSTGTGGGLWLSALPCEAHSSDC